MARPAKRFSKFFLTITTIYNIFLLVPKFKKSPNDRGRLYITAVTVVLVLAYWIGIGFSFTRKVESSSVSIVSNIIQLLLNAITFTIVVLNPVHNGQCFGELMDRLNDVDDLLAKIDQPLDYKKHRHNFLVSILSVFACLAYLFIFDLAVLGLKYEYTSAAYWILYSIPRLFIAFSVHLIVLFLTCIHQRLAAVGGLIKIKSMLRVSQNSNPRWQELRDPMELHQDTLYLITRDIFIATEKFNDFFGLSLLFIVASLFTVTSVQSFYLLNIVMNFLGGTEPYVDMMFTSINIILLNLALIFGICHKAEAVGQEASRILTSIMEDPRQKNDNNWVRIILTRISFHAKGFFVINFNTLFGFFSAMITYLIILLQFNFVMEDKAPHEYKDLPPLGVSGDGSKIPDF